MKRTDWIVRASLLSALSVLGCASSAPQLAATTPTASTSPTQCDPARDRAAIRAMAGEFHVAFSFRETEALEPGYSPRKPYETDASEVVEILEDSAQKIVLQHVLMFEPAHGPAKAMKHWRQDWTYQDATMIEFRGHDAFEHSAVPASALPCSWTQAVFEVDDGPRYESYGRWLHEGDKSTWTSQETWRPLPRREYTKRHDYDVLVGVNRHIVTPSGWVHEQDNVKLVQDESRKLVRERGLNRYERTSIASAPVARAYLQETGAFWDGVRKAWESAVATARRVTITTELDGKPRHEKFFALAEAADKLAVKALVERCVQPQTSDATVALQTP